MKGSESRELVAILERIAAALEKPKASSKKTTASTAKGK